DQTERHRIGFSAFVKRHQSLMHQRFQKVIARAGVKLKIACNTGHTHACRRRAEIAENPQAADKRLHEVFWLFGCHSESREFLCIWKMENCDMKTSNTQTRLPKTRRSTPSPWCAIGQDRILSSPAHPHD